MASLTSYSQRRDDGPGSRAQSSEQLINRVMADMNVNANLQNFQMNQYAPSTGGVSGVNILKNIDLYPIDEEREENWSHSDLQKQNAKPLEQQKRNHQMAVVSLSNYGDAGQNKAGRIEQHLKDRGDYNNIYLGNIDEGEDDEEEVYMDNSEHSDSQNDEPLFSSVPTEGLLVHVEFNIKEDIQRITSTPTESDVNFTEPKESENMEESKSHIELEPIKEQETLNHNPLLQNKGQRRLQQPNFAGTVNLVTSEFGTYYVEEPGDTGGERELYRNKSINRSNQQDPHKKLTDLRRDRTQNRKFGNHQAHSQILSNQFSSSAFKGHASKDTSNPKLRMQGEGLESLSKLQVVIQQQATTTGGRIEELPEEQVLTNKADTYKDFQQEACKEQVERQGSRLPYLNQTEMVSTIRENALTLQVKVDSQMVTSPHHEERIIEKIMDRVNQQVSMSKSAIKANSKVFEFEGELHLDDIEYLPKRGFTLNHRSPKLHRDIMDEQRTDDLLNQENIEEIKEEFKDPKLPLKSILKFAQKQEYKAQKSNLSASKKQDKSVYQHLVNEVFAQKKPLPRVGLVENDPYTLYVFREGSCFRQNLTNLVDSKAFEYCMIFAIFFNSITLALFDYTDRQSLTTKNQVINMINTSCTAIFTLEAVFKIVAHGLFQAKKSYLRSGWNIIDAIVVISGLLELALGKLKLKALRVVRVFRPLKSVTAHKGLKKLVSTLIEALTDLANVATFLIYIFLLFAILGLHQYNGTYSNICRYHEQPENSTLWQFDMSIERVCSQTGLGGYQCPQGMYCGNHDQNRVYDSASDRIEDRAYAIYGVFNFDNIWNSLLTVTMIINSNTWYQHMLNMMDADIPFLGALYCFLMIIIGQFFLINLILAVIIQSFIRIQKQELEPELALISNLDEALTQDISSKRQGKRVVIMNEIKIENNQEAQARKAGYGDSIESFNNEIDDPTKDIDKSQKDLIKKVKQNKNQENSDSSDIDYKKRFLKDPVAKPVVTIQNKKKSALKRKLTIYSKELKEIPPKEKIQVIQLTLEERAREFERKLQRNLEDQYRDYFKRIIREAQHNFRGPDRLEYLRKANLREIVGLRVGLNVINGEKEFERQYDRRLKIEWRAMRNPLYNRALLLVESGVFGLFISLVILANLCVLCLDRYQGDDSDLIEKMNIFFTVIYACELFINLTAMGVKCYYQGSYSNVLDSAIVCISTIDIIITLTVGSTGSIITALRGFRLLRVFKLAKNWRRFSLMLEVMGRTLVDVGVFAILVALFIFTFTLLGMELFAQEAKFSGDIVDEVKGVSPRYNFDTFQNALFTVFICLTNDATTEVWISYQRAVDATSSAIYFLLLIVLGQRLLLNIFLAILIQNFDEGAFRQKMLDFSEAQQDIRRRIIGALTIDEKLINCLKARIRTLRLCRRTQALEEKNESYHKANAHYPKKQIGKSLTVMIQQDQNLRPVILGTSLNLFNEDNRLRISIFNMIQHPRFDQFINMAIILSAIQLALDDSKVQPESSKYQVLFWIDVQTTLIFVIEALLKIIAFGLFQNGQCSYLRRIWNQVDLLIIIFSVISLTPLSDDFNTIKVLRVMRLIRWITKNPGLQTAVQALILAIPNVFSILIVFILFLFVFGVITVSQFKGLSFKCSDSLTQELHSQWSCLNTGGEWSNGTFNFDNSINSLVTLFILATSTNWGEITLNFIQSREIGYESDPSGQYKTAWLIFFSVFVTIGYLFFLNLFVGVVISTFNAENDRLSGVDFLTEQQKEWIQMKLLVLKRTGAKRERVPLDSSRRLLYRLQKHIAFDRTIMFLIILNMVVLCVKWHEQPSQVSQATEYINYVFTGCFLVEIMIKVLALGCREYFHEGWNVFDSIVIFGSFVSIFVSANSSFSLKGVFTILRSFRVLRLLRLIKRGSSLQIIFNTILITLKAFTNIGALLLLVIFIYTIMGMMVFGSIKHAGAMNDWINFETFPSGFITLFIVATGDSWSKIMQSFSYSQGPSYQCIQDPKFEDFDKFGQPMGCGSKSVAFAFFLSYIVIVNLIFLKIFIAIVLQGYKDTQAQYDLKIDTDLQDKYQAVWNEFDVHDSTFLPISKLRTFLAALGAPLGFDAILLKDQTLQDGFISSLELPTYNGFEFYQYQDIFDSLTLKLMVIERLKQQRLEEEERERKGTHVGEEQEMGNVISKEMEMQIKAELNLEVNKLFVVQKQTGAQSRYLINNNQDDELNAIKQRIRDKDGTNSSHQILAEGVVRKFRELLQRYRDTSLHFDEQKQASIGKKFGFSAKQLKGGQKGWSSSKKHQEGMPMKGNTKLKGQKVKVDDAFYGAFQESNNVPSKPKNGKKQTKSGMVVFTSKKQKNEQVANNHVEENKISELPQTQVIQIRQGKVENPLEKQVLSDSSSEFYVNKPLSPKSQSSANMAQVPMDPIQLSEIGAGRSSSESKIGLE